MPTLVDPPTSPNSFKNHTSFKKDPNSEKKSFWYFSGSFRIISCRNRMIFFVRTPPILLMRAVSCGFSLLRLRGRSSLSTTPLTKRSHSGRRSGHLASIRT